MRKTMFRAVCCCGLIGLLLACQRTLPFADYQREFFQVTPVTTSTTQVVKLVNPEGDAPQHITSVGFDPGRNEGSHFDIERVTVGGKKVGRKDVSVPPGAALAIHVRYTPRNFETTEADFGGWETGAPRRPGPVAPPADDDDEEQDSDEEDENDEAKSAVVATNVLSFLAGKAALSNETPDEVHASDDALDSNKPVHRALLNVLYDIPRQGMIQLEVVGQPLPGPNGELSVSGGSSGGDESSGGACSAGGTQACLAGTLSLQLPGLMAEGVETDLSGPVAFVIDGDAVSLDMKTFPVAVFVVEGNGPGEPLEGQPIGAVTLAISGDEESKGAGSFDGTSMTLDGIGFRIRIYVGLSLSLADVASQSTPIDFRVTGLTMTTTEPLASGSITLQVKETLGEAPSGSPLVDPILKNKDVILELKGALELP